MPFKRKQSDGSRSENYYFFIRHDKKSLFRSTGTSDVEEARRVEKAVRKGLKSEHAAKVLEALNGAMLRRQVCTIGEAIAACEAEGVRVFKSGSHARRITNDLRLVVAHARDLWTVNEGGRQGVKVGARIADARRIDALSTGVLNKALKLDYFRACTEDGELDWNEAAEGNVSINSRLAHAMDVFRGKTRTHKLDGLELPDLREWLAPLWLPEDEPEPEPVRADLFAVMVAQAAALREGTPEEVVKALLGSLRANRKLTLWVEASGRWSSGVRLGYELWLCNAIFRQTGMRSGSVLYLHRDWLVKHADGWWCDVRVRKGGTASYSVPLSDELGEILAKREGYILLPEGGETDRGNLLKVHNAFLKSLIGGLGENAQGNHRLRDTVAGALYAWLGMAAACEALGHASPVTTRKHYANLRLDVSALMKAEMGAWERLARGKRGD